jgi:hypothetical protein
MIFVCASDHVVKLAFGLRKTPYDLAVTRPSVAGPPRLRINKLADFELVLGHNESALLFRLIAAHIAELMRPFDEAALPVRAFLNGCSSVAERVNRSPGQIRGFASAPCFDGARGRRGGKGLCDQLADRYGTRGKVALFLPPSINCLEFIGLPAHADLKPGTGGPRTALRFFGTAY